MAGPLKGVSCATFPVEIFSDSDGEGVVYEGNVETSEDGMFTFEKGAPFAGPALTSTSTDPDGQRSR
jgi:hypothetical protein